MDLRKGILDLIESSANNIKSTAKGVARQLNTKDGGQTFTKVNAPRPIKPSFAPLPTIDTSQPLPTIGADGIPSGIGKHGAVFRRGNWVVGQGSMLYDPYGKNRKQEYADSAYLRIAPHFKEYQDFEPKKQITTMNNLLGRY